MQPRIHVITLGVRDLERSLEFYRGLGLQSPGVGGTELPGDDTNPAGAVAMFELQGGLILALYPRTELAKTPTLRSDQPISRRVQHRPCRAEEDGRGRAACPGRDGRRNADERAPRPFLGIYSGYFRDPDGHLWEVLWNPQLDLEDA